MCMWGTSIYTEFFVIYLKRKKKIFPPVPNVGYTYHVCTISVCVYL